MPLTTPSRSTNALAAIGPPRIDFLLPHTTWDAPALGSALDGTEYADWLIAVCDQWTTTAGSAMIANYIRANE